MGTPRFNLVADVVGSRVWVPLSICALEKGEFTVVELATVFQLMREARVEREGLATRTANVGDGDVDPLAIRRRVALRTLEVITADTEAVLHFRALKAIHGCQLVGIFLFVSIEELKVLLILPFRIIIGEVTISPVGSIKASGLFRQ